MYYTCIISYFNIISFIIYHMCFTVSYHFLKNSLIQYFQKSGQKNIQLA